MGTIRHLGHLGSLLEAKFGIVDDELLRHEELTAFKVAPAFDPHLLFLRQQKQEVHLKVEKVCREHH